LKNTWAPHLAAVGSWDLLRSELAARTVSAETWKNFWRSQDLASLAIVDAGPLYSAVDTDEADHLHCLEALSRTDLILVVPALVITEVLHFVNKRLGPRAESAFIQGLEAFQIEAPTPADLRRMAELVEQYSDFPLGGTDASIVALAERLGAATIITLDRRHFGSVKPKHVESFKLLP